LFGVPSSSIIARSTSAWSKGLIPRTAGAIASSTFDTASSTPFPA
jgi:hypothetical protein